MQLNLTGLSMPRSSHAVTTLLNAVLAVGSGLDLSEVLTRIVRSACDLVGARYGALGVLRPDGEGLMEFVTSGLTPEEAGQVASQPFGHGVLGTLIRDPRPLRLSAVGEHPDAVGFPPGHPVMTTFLGAPIHVRGEVFGNIYLADKVGGLEFTGEDEELIVALAAAAGMAIDNARMFHMARSGRQWSDALREMTQALLYGRDQRVALSMLVQRAQLAAEAELAAVALAGEDGQLIIEASTGTDPRSRLIVGTPLAEPHWVTILDSGEPLLLLSREGEAVADSLAAQLREASGLPPHGQTAIVPMSVGTGSLGLLVVAWGEGESHTAYDAAEPLKQYADLAAVTLTAASAQRDRARMVVLEDRERIARDMHDVVIQRLFATGLGLQSASRVAAHPYVQKRLSEAVDELDLAIKDIRRMIFALHQPESQPLSEELHDLVVSFAEPLGFTPRLTVVGPLDDPETVDEWLRLDLLAVIREALSNVARHAQAGEVDVAVVVQADLVQVTVEDDGVGMIETGRRSGLANLSERAAGRRGSLVVLSPMAVLGGTRVIWEVPASVGAGPTGDPL
ncbi:MAG TPA: GAF domain-containing protein [Dermatophilaceae bacterium]|uniref:GAF domain-containing protein n=1 Tax=Candidatus Phosphoribacter hodrii TaxID=2953743 RepID=A0A9D7T8Y5_9MICO|nr:GAF domain-containing protein [Candidatus Phosphoribacter hodrii]OPZ54715.1 MAG: Redox sensor histidine kinase response regulator DevS [bacterium ADurb.BinA028]HNV15340.1 GAF domain-containing protein [Dermatophilaceae bacterium]HOA01139.1 GAF domain-containing protein [Dermatophilaceae bacterium]HOA56796.1 GAF domain-containing protein [Dermatophilaceae bacterium]